MAEPGFRTCSIESHRAFQKAGEERNTAMFQLHTRLRQAGISQVPRAGSEADLQSQSARAELSAQVPLAGPELHDPPVTLGASAASSGAKVKGKLARSWTHNEQLFVRCCGVIISRATFFGSEGITGVTVNSISFHCTLFTYCALADFSQSDISP
jgi:hypothetical protein